MAAYGVQTGGNGGAGDGNSLWRDASQPSIASSAHGMQSEPSVFERELPQGVEVFDVRVPRGLRVHGSPRLAGQMRNTKIRVPTRKYCVTVEPGARVKKPKDLLRESAKTAPEALVDAEGYKASGSSPVAETLLESGVDRMVFRNERVRRFQLGNHFPALVSPRLVPSWKLSEAGRLSVSRDRELATASSVSKPQATPRRKSIEDSTLTKPTMAHALKQTDKRLPESAPPWTVSGPAAARQLICDRKPVLHADEYDSSRELFGRGEESKELWVTESPMLPTSAAASKAGFDAMRPHLDSHIAAMRERGRAFNKSLKDRYETSRKNFQKEKAGQAERLLGLSSFEKSLMDKAMAEAAQKAARVATAKVTESDKKKDTRFVGLMDRNLSSGGPGSDLLSPLAGGRPR